ncbi:MBL fold metallo-hydrolase [Thermoproteus tenax]|uniref:UPF0282 protein TTX_0847 n=1 Tax=Thermoproteus tenax (strain ATCC 35583 / DSM 2078 / JCM 9277 / NBRC 100435 / Kra 1) TaxID=768679 RepID=G4RPK7_THETK|nr:MBL fold metallo-hydrolase [Thermoproteus tenax]CCC81502.1 metallo-beta-lactamase family protein [Thermoproteus tenax Kra 1]
MEIVPIAEESLGVRSMALFVRTSDVGILFDAGISLAPRRDGLPPHPLELGRVAELRRAMLDLAPQADVITVSHYHRDHFTPWYASAYMGTDEGTFRAIYSGKLILAKSPQGLNWSQRRRHYGFAKAVGDIARVEYADGKAYEFGGTKIYVSTPLPHGPEGSAAGFVIAFSVEVADEKLLFMPDVQGPANEKALSFAREVRPDIVIVGGPPLYLKSVDSTIGLRGLKKLSQTPGLQLLVVAHHTLRELNWKRILSPILELAAKRGIEVKTYAELLGREVDLLEARRRELYRETPVGERK